MRVIAVVVYVYYNGGNKIHFCATSSSPRGERMALIFYNKVEIKWN